MDDEPPIERSQRDTPIKESGKRGPRSPLEGQMRKKPLLTIPGRLGSIKVTRSFEPKNSTMVNLESENVPTPTQ